MTNQANNNPGNAQNQPPQRPNPFASRLGGTAQRPAGTQPAPNAAPPFGGSLLRRTNPNEILWSVSPIYSAFVRFQLGGLGDPFHRLLGMPFNVEFGNSAKVVAMLQTDSDLHEKLTTLLEQTWLTYGFKGAAILYPWEEDVRKAITQPPQPVYVAPANNANNDDDSDDNGDSQEWVNNPKPVRPPETLRAIDLSLVLNVLARVRSNILVANTPLALEPGFLEQSFITDDPRLVAMARATGSIEETW